MLTTQWVTTGSGDAPPAVSRITHPKCDERHPPLKAALLLRCEVLVVDAVGASALLHPGTHADSLHQRQAVGYSVEPDRDRPCADLGRLCANAQFAGMPCCLR